MKDVADAIQMGQKRKQKDNIIEAFQSYYGIVYSEYFIREHDIHKVYPITVKIW